MIFYDRKNKHDFVREMMKLMSFGKTFPVSSDKFPGIYLLN